MKNVLLVDLHEEDTHSGNDEPRNIAITYSLLLLEIYCFDATVILESMWTSLTYVLPVDWNS